MFFLEGIWNGLSEIWSHKLRSFLTTICVMLGVASMVLIVGLVNGLFRHWHMWLQESGGLQKVTVYPAPLPENQNHLRGLSPGRTMDDVRAIEAISLHAKLVSPEINLNNALMKRKGNTCFPNVSGVLPAVLIADRYEVSEGRFFGDLDLAHAEPVVVLGSAPVEKLYSPGEQIIGSMVDINNQPFRVIGLLKKNEMKQGRYNYLDWKNEIAFVPITAMQQRLYGSSQLNGLSVMVDDPKNLDVLVAELENILFHSHRGLKDFRLRTSQESMGRLTSMENSFYAVGGGIGLITLVVGGIGIMNLMLASINERIREIGIRKALGAWNRDIFVQFLAESIALSTCGGCFGIGAGIGLIRFMQYMMKNAESGISPPDISPGAIIIGFGFSVLIGIVAGIYPAFRAASLDPIEALRYE